LPSKNNYKEYRKGLSGKIEYQGSNLNINEFFGYFRLKKDPKVETLTIENFIPRGTTIKYADWVFGLIVFAGANTKIMLNSNYKRHKNSYIEYLTQLYFILSALVVFFFAMIHTIAIIARVKAYNLVINFPSLIKADPNIEDTSRFIIYIVLYSPLMPIFLYGFLDLTNFFQKLIIEYKFSREFKGETCKILDPIPFVNIAQAKYALIDKTGTLTTSNYRINQIFFNNKLYKIRIDPKSILENISEQEKIKYFSAPFKNTSTKGEILFANNFLNSTNIKDLSIISTMDNRQTKKFLSKIDESHLDLEDVSVHSDQEQINEIKIDNIFDFKRNIESIDDINGTNKYENEDIRHTKRSSTDIVRKLLGQENSSPSSNVLQKIEIQMPKNSLSKTQDLSTPTEIKIVVNHNKVYESLLNNSVNNNDNSQISFRNDINKIDENFPLKNNLASPLNSNRSLESSPYQYLYHTERDFLQDLLKANSDLNLDSLFEALTLCHGARTQLSSSKVICSRREDDVILDFSKKCYYVFDKTDNPENPSQYYLKYKTQKLVYTIFGINDFYHEKKSFSVVYKSPINDELFLICKGEEDYMRGLISMRKKELEIYDFLIKDMQNQGLKPIVYARKPLSSSETQIYYNTMRNLKTSLITQTDQLNLLGKSLEYNLELLIIVGLKDELTEGVEETIEFFNEIGLNVWMVTGDCKENAISSAIAAKICNPMIQKPREITQEDEASLNVTIRNYLIDVKNMYNAIKTQTEKETEKKEIDVEDKERFGYKFSRQMSSYLFRVRSERNGTTLLTQNQKIFSELKEKMQNIFMILNGKSLEIIMRDSFLKSHLIFLLSLIKNIVAYNLSPEMKATLVSIIQNDFVSNPSVIAIGDNYNDVLMLQKADIGIELIKKGPIEQRINAGDIQISNLKLLRSIMLFEGVPRIILQENMIFFLFYQSFLMGISLFLLYWFCAIPLNRLFYSLMIFFYFLFFTSPSILIYGLFDKPIKERILNVFPGLFCEGILKKRFIARRFILKSVVDALLHSVLIFYISFYSISYSVVQEGFTGGINTFVLTILILLILMNNIKILIKGIVNKVRLILLTFLINVVLLVFFILISVEDEKTWSNWASDIQFQLSNIAGIMIIIGIIFICFTLSYLMENYVYQYVVPSLYDTFSNQKIVGNWREITNERLVKYFEIPRFSLKKINKMTKF